MIVSLLKREYLEKAEMAARRAALTEFADDKAGWTNAAELYRACARAVEPDIPHAAPEKA